MANIDLPIRTPSNPSNAQIALLVAGQALSKASSPSTPMLLRTADQLKKWLDDNS